ncbi:MAG: Grx4 family monothiol glutaredoxin [Pseudomonadota bacterium]|nr:Grx4 family monothiol glutaredoxin [Pseudomonadota bacterium]MDP1905778.1 Grx4 family monothiol glutaredoxin [Pseudomonadota bacterium]MDP2354008.1 Grx4 family monothiol glutaredoxin [Pseudomonadota bacterium]
MDMKEQVHQLVTSKPVVLYMKGTPQFPQCGFSANAANILKACGLTDFVAVNVLSDDNIRIAIKEYANWPTIPQLYIGGQFIGGSDIMRDLYQTGELQKLLTAAQAS